MGNNNSVQQNLSNDEIMANINHLFAPYQQTETSYDTIHSLDMNNMSGGCVTCKRNRYAEFENQLGGELINANKEIMYNKLAKFAPQSGGNNYSELDELDFDNNDQLGGDGEITSDMFKSELAHVGNLSATSFENNSQQNGGQINLTATSNALMSELARVDNLSATSVGNNFQAGGQINNTATSNMFMSEIAQLGNLSATSNGLMTGGCGCGIEKKLSEEQFIRKHTSPKSETSVVDSLTNMTLDKTVQDGGCPSCVQTGGCPSCSATSVMKTSEMFGGKIQTSEEMNIMPFYSSTSGTEYYSNMQKAHRYT